MLPYLWGETSGSLVLKNHHQLLLVLFERQGSSGSARRGGRSSSTPIVEVWTADAHDSNAGLHFDGCSGSGW